MSLRRSAHRRARRSPTAIVAVIGAAALATVLGTGCSAWPFRDNDRSSIITPGMRVATIRERGLKAANGTSADQLAACEELAQQIRTEPDPIVRRSIQETISRFDVPLATAVLLAGLNDEDRGVRTTCCRLLGQRQAAEAVAPLSQIVAADSDPEVRMAAVAALGKYRSTESVRGLVPAIKDRDPAMQFAGVKAMQSASGEKLGNDVAAWRQYAESLPSVPTPGLGGVEVNIAQQPGDGTSVR